MKKTVTLDGTKFTLVPVYTDNPDGRSLMGYMLLPVPKTKGKKPM